MNFSTSLFIFKLQLGVVPVDERGLERATGRLGMLSGDLQPDEQAIFSARGRGQRPRRIRLKWLWSYDFSPEWGNEKEGP